MIVLDTHVIIWDALSPSNLSSEAKNLIQQANRNDGIVFCEISLWEIAMLIQKKRIIIETDYLTFIKYVYASNKYFYQHLTPEIADLATSFPPEINQDPADRIIAATSVELDAILVTADQNLRKSKLLNTIW